MRQHLQMRLGSIVKMLREQRGWDQPELSFRSGVKVGTISAIEVRNSVRSEHAPALARAFGMTIDGMMSYGSEDQKPSKSVVNETSNISAARAYSGEVPVINWVQAGAWQDVAEAVEPERYLPIFKGHSSNSYALRVRGDSMTASHGKSYPDGCYIIVDPARVSPVNGDRVVARLKGVAEATFKVFKHEDGRQWLAPLNQMHKPIYDGFTVIGTVIGKWEDE